MLFSFSLAGFEGTLCERNIDDCSPDPCHHGTCMDGIASFTCTCLAGYTGYRCENQINECHSNPCQHGGKCIDLVNKYLCHCQPGTSGRIFLPATPLEAGSGSVISKEHLSALVDTTRQHKVLLGIMGSIFRL